MKLLTTEQQVELQQLFDVLSGLGNAIDVPTLAEINYWKGELKAKRVRRNKPENSA